MFDIAPTEMMLVALVALVVIGPKDLPKVLRTVGQWIGRAKGMARHFRSGLDDMVRAAELEEMEKKWAAENERIMREHPSPYATPAVQSAAPDSDVPVMTPLPPTEAGPLLAKPGDATPAADAPPKDAIQP